MSLYEPLIEATDEVRLLKILPAQDCNDDRVSCLMYKTLLPSISLKYAALSYVWGDPSVTEEIMVNGTLMAVTTNLANALRELRRRASLQPVETRLAAELARGQNPEAMSEDIFEDLPLWVDAICINQNDMSERNKQAPRMSHIYTNAANVIGWISGPPFSDQDITLCFPFVRGISRAYGSAAECESGTLQPGLSYLMENRQFCTYEEGSALFGNHYWQSLADLLKAKYWRRVWIVQEVVLARSSTSLILVCGQETMRMEDLITAAFFVKKLHHPASYHACPGYMDRGLWVLLTTNRPVMMVPMMMRINMIRKGYKRQQGHLAMELSVAMASKATDPRDIVYGMLGITQAKICVDYNKPVWEVYLDWMRWALSTQERDSARYFGLALAMAGIGIYKTERQDDGFQTYSWLPNFSAPEFKPGHIYPMEDLHSRISWKKARSPLVHPDGSLDIHGVVYDDIVHTVRFDQVPENVAEVLAEAENSPLETICLYTGLMMSQGDVKPKHPPLVSLFDIFTIWYRRDTEQKLAVQPNSVAAQAFLYLFDHPHDRYGLRNFYGITTRADYQLWLDARRSMPEFQDRGVTEKFHYLKSTVSGCIDLNKGNRCLFRTEKGLFGSGPPGVQDGDKICILDFSDIAVILRPDRAFWRFVGTCFVSGLSKREVKEDIESGNLQCQDFLIK
ncbi:heterokaryon incompatibility protein-domain-containing protein [Stachybotrys elegans]|uniref:Heterokaryon incompatibility protein-domain-containing protein n=1 Tax=Stachybotrys elegans TaxID=80388 RepID=A0A8K0T003_9HYPO|nr:heterokaryon incompatibility protein-domain-containing protein [Stachybotrys elegans]